MTQTKAPTQDSAGARGHHDGAATGVDDHHDPLHDIDGFKTIVAVFGSLFAIVFLIWVMTHLFNVMVQVEQQAKIADIPTTEINNIRAEEDRELSGKNPNRGTKTIEQAMRELAK
jgi:hypothetical protein